MFRNTEAGTGQQGHSCRGSGDLHLPALSHLPPHSGPCELGKEGITRTLQIGGLRLKTEVALLHVTVSD